MGSTGWMLVHPTRGADKRSITFQEERPGGILVKMTDWRWQRVLITPDHADAFGETAKPTATKES